MSHQDTAVLNHLRKKGSITRLEATTLYRIAHLPTRILNLRRAGYGIKTVMREDLTGHKYAHYELEAV